MTEQNRWAMFVSANARVGKWGFGAGLRYDNINFDYYQNQVFNNEQSKSYGKFFPNVQVGYSSDNIQTVVGYERKIQYPTYSQLRSNVQYSSPFVYESGNPLLQPQIQNDFTGMFAYKELKVMLGYTIYEDYITQLMSLYDGNPIVLISTENVNDASSSFFAVSYTPVVHFWRPNFEVGGQWQSFDLGDGQDYNNTAKNGGKRHFIICKFGGKRQIWHYEIGGRRHFEFKTFGGKYEKPYLCIKIKDYGRGYNSF